MYRIYQLKFILVKLHENNNHDKLNLISLIILKFITQQSMACKPF